MRQRQVSECKTVQRLSCSLIYIWTVVSTIYRENSELLLLKAVNTEHEVSNCNSLENTRKQLISTKPLCATTSAHHTVLLENFSVKKLFKMPKKDLCLKDVCVVSVKVDTGVAERKRQDKNVSCAESRFAARTHAWLQSNVITYDSTNALEWSQTRRKVAFRRPFWRAYVTAMHEVNSRRPTARKIRAWAEVYLTELSSRFEWWPHSAKEPLKRDASSCVLCQLNNRAICNLRWLRILTHPSFCYHNELYLLISSACHKNLTTV